MTERLKRSDRLPRGIGSFMLTVLRDFKRNQGMILSGAVAYYTLLSIIPMLILTLIALSHFIEEEQLLHTVSTHLEMVVPVYAATLTDQVRTFLRHRQVLGVIGFMVMVPFSSAAFTVLENAITAIFFHSVRIQRRHFLVSAVIPHVYIFLLSLGMLLVSFIAGALEHIESRHVELLGWALRLGGASGLALYLLGITGEVLMLTSLYLVMPIGRITFRHALIGGMSATFLWEITRRVLVWYYSTLSLVNLIYGSFATAVVALLSIEAAAMILLFCAQVIAELDREKNKPVQKSGPGFQI